MFRSLVRMGRTATDVGSFFSLTQTRKEGRGERRKKEKGRDEKGEKEKRSKKGRRQVKGEENKRSEEGKSEEERREQMRDE